MNDLIDIIATLKEEKDHIFKLTISKVKKN